MIVFWKINFSHLKPLERLPRTIDSSPQEDFMMQKKEIFQQIFGKASSAVLSARIACSWESTVFLQNPGWNNISGEGDG